MGRNSGLDPDLMYRLGGLISKHHRWARVFKQAHEVFQRLNANEVSLRLTVNCDQDRRRYNLPTSDEVAIAIPGDGNQVNSSRDIVLHRRDGHLRRVNEGSVMYECLQYPLFFIYGENGYHYDLTMSSTSNKRLSRTDYTAYRIQQREPEFSLLLCGGRLFQQFLVDMWATADQSGSTTFVTINRRSVHLSTVVSLTLSRTMSTCMALVNDLPSCCHTPVALDT